MSLYSTGFSLKIVFCPIHCNPSPACVGEQRNCAKDLSVQSLTIFVQPILDKKIFDEQPVYYYLYMGLVITEMQYRFMIVKSNLMVIKRDQDNLDGGLIIWSLNNVYVHYN